MANDPGPAPVPMSLALRVRAAGRRFTQAAALLCLAAPLFGLQQLDPVVAAQTSLAKCQDIFLTCAKACVGAEPCLVCEDERKKCRTEVYSTNTGVLMRQLLPGLELPGGWVFPNLPVPSNGDSTPKFPWLNLPMPPPGQKADHCDPDNYDQILQRYRGANGGGPSADSLLTRIDLESDTLTTAVETLQAIVDDPEKSGREKRAAQKTIDDLQQRLAVLRGAAKLIRALQERGEISETSLIALDRIVTRVVEKGLQERGGLASKLVGEDGSEASVIRSTMTSYDDKENALGRLLAAYGAGQNLPDIGSSNTPGDMSALADRTARESLIAACRGEPMGPAAPGGRGGGGGDDTPQECKGEPYDSVEQCCSAEGVGARVEKTRFTIDDCPPSRRAPNPDYQTKRNGCGTDLSNKVTGDLPNNPNFRLEPDGFFWVRIRGVPVPIQKYKRVYYGPSFLPACDFHDECWGTCNTPETGTSQENCDDEFGQRMNQICDSNLTGEDLVSCRLRATIYQGAVELNVLYAYDAAQSDACHCCEGTGP